MGVFPYRQPPARSPLPARALSQSVLHTTGSEAALRALLMERHSAAGAVLLASGTHALTIALRSAAQRRPGLPVLLPAYTCFEVATAAVGAEVPVALYDLNPGSLEPDWEAIRQTASEGAAALVVAPLYGMVVDWDAARSAADAMQALLIEDAAQSHGSTWRGAPAGSIGDLSILSFGRGKGWTGVAGGALLARGDAATVLEMALLDPPRGRAGLVASAVAQWLLARPALYALPAAIPALHLGETIYHDPTPPAAIAPYSAALVRATDEAARAEAEIRRGHASKYETELREQAAEALFRSDSRNGAPGALRFPVRIKGGWSAARDAGLDRLGVGPPYPSLLASLPALQRRLNDPRSSYPASAAIVRELITLPTHSGTRSVDRARLVEWIGQRPLRSTGPHRVA